MEMTGEQLVPATQQQTWDALNDPEMLKACVPGCEAIEPVAQNEYQVAMVARVGPVSAKFKGKLSLSDLDPPNSYSIAFEGQGGAAGFGKGSARVTLAPQEGGTRLGYAVKASVGGKLAQIGSRLVDAAARKIADDFFKAFNDKVAALHGATAQAEDHGEEHDEQHPEPVPPDPDMPTISTSAVALIAAGALVIVIAALFMLYG